MPTQDTWIYLAFIARNEKKFEEKKSVRNP